MPDANLLVTFDPTHEISARREVTTLIEKEKPKFLKSGVDGTFLLRVKDSKKVVSALKKKAGKSALFRYTYKWTPIEKWCSSSVAVMAKNVAAYDKKIGSGERWKMELNKRMHEGSEMELIMKLTERINKKKVDLKNPQKIIHVEILKKKAGLSLLTPDEQLNTHDFRK
jgi:tRNA(Ser,Leu) C12 N-acetylase TAN1